MSRFYGKYRGTVSNNVDPNAQGRVQVQVPAVLGQGQLSWAMTCAPFAGNQVGFLAVPPVGANVWVEFEGGDPNYPICSGAFWGSGECPASLGPPLQHIFKTSSATITLDDTPGTGGIMLELASGPKIKLAATGIELDNGQGAVIKLAGPQVTINNGALEVT